MPPPPSRRPGQRPRRPETTDPPPDARAQVAEFTAGVRRYRATLLEPPGAWRWMPTPIGGSWVKGRMQVVATLGEDLRALTVSLSRRESAQPPSAAEVEEVCRAFIPPGLPVEAGPSGRLYYLTTTLVDPAEAGMHWHPLAGNPEAREGGDPRWRTTRYDGAEVAFSDALKAPDGWTLSHTETIPLYLRGEVAVALSEYTDREGRRWREAFVSRPVAEQGDHGALWREVVAWAFGPRAYVLIFGGEEKGAGAKARTSARLAAVLEPREGPGGGHHGVRWLQEFAAREGRLFCLWPGGTASLIAREARDAEEHGRGWGVVTDRAALAQPTATVLVPDGGCWRCDLGAHLGEFTAPRAWRRWRAN